ncbi:MAG TPA: 4-(cytidine 5'-diphospho)-2-C-methyl-D-erythritol kinase [Pyrinomonadaceae bacterium]|nr:4-(cytidine 5'-diphospho)-2-C-methyl-D-erythritol kinase [Pyrinomonadaceae bacterium]
MKLRAPAKVNLSLRVVGKRRDGYHLIDTIMVPVSLYDEIEIKRAKPGAKLTVTCDDPKIPSGKNNLAYKAAALILGKAAEQRPVAIHIRKRIPAGAGLGGGSSDAAAVLIGVNRLLRLGKSRRELMKLAVKIGADVPFFILGRPARARGIGERLKALKRGPSLWLVIAYPGFPISTGWAYHSLDFKLTKNPGKTSLNRHVWPLRGHALELVNDLEKPVLRRYSKVARLKRRLAEAGAAGTLMSGSGSSVFGLFSSGDKAKKAFLRLERGDGIQAFLVRSLQ